MVCRRSGLCILVIILMLAQQGTAAAQERGTLSGTVVEELTNRPLAGAQIVVVGTDVGTVTGEGGQYTLPNVPAGRIRLLVQLIGYKPVEREVTMGAGVTESVDFMLTQTAIALDEVVVTGAWVATQKRKLGNTVATINATSFENAPVRNLSELLTGREPGVTALPSGGFAGEGARFRIRGSASLSQLNQPIVYLDGVRVTNGGGFAPNVGAGGGGEPSRFDDINPAAIERIEILKGAAAATLYGTEASSGVIQIFTKRGSTGEPRYEVAIEQGFTHYPNRYEPHAGFAQSGTQRVTMPGGLVVRSADELSRHWGLDIRPFDVFQLDLIPQLYETGHTTTVTTSLSGGSPLLTYFITGRMANENGPFGGRFLGPAQDRDESRQVNASLTLFPRDRLRLRLNTMYTERYHEVPENNNNVYGVLSSLINSRPQAAHCDASSRATVSPVPGLCTGAGNPWGAASFITTREAMQSINNDEVRRFSGSLGATWDVMGVTLDGTLGIDVLNQHGVSHLPFHYNVDDFTANDVEGFRGVGDLDNRELTSDFRVSWNRQPNERWSLQTILGMQAFFSDRATSGGTGRRFPGEGVVVLNATAERIAHESFVQTAQLGVFGQEQIGYDDWAFLTLGGRYDKHSAFGESAGAVFYPKASLSLVPSDAFGWSSTMLSSLRVRAAVGRSGRQPSAFARFTTYGAQASELGPGLTPNNLGNQDLAPEVSTEVEAGLELGLFGDRIGLEGTWWRRTVDDVLIERQFPVSGGFTAPQLDNIGTMKAHGFELGARGFVVSTPALQVNLFATASFLRETITDMGGAPPLKAGGSYPRYRNSVREGYAPGSFFGAKLLETSGDQFPFDQNNDCRPDTRPQALAYFGQPRNPDAINVLVQGGDPRAACASGDYLGHYLGKPMPDWSGSFGSEITLLGNLRVNGLFEFKAGEYFVHDLTTAFRRSHPLIGRNTPLSAAVEATLLDPASSPEERLRAADTWARELRALSPYDGLNEIFAADYIRWRELSVTYTVPARLAERLGARSLAITAAGRNLALWTRFPGADPDINVIGVARDGSVDNNFLSGTAGWGVPLPRRISFAARVVF
jgi:TonB-linked SusC/RagA family outer membrane protein